jgi:hypothetical protein
MEHIQCGHLRKCLLLDVDFHVTVHPLTHSL